MPVEGDASTQEAEDLFITVLQSASAADGNGTVADTAGLAGPTSVELINTGTGTGNITLEGSYDGINWYAIGYYQIDNVPTPSRSTSAIPVTASTFAHVYLLLDPYSRVRARQSSSSGTPAITATLRGMPV